MVTRPSIAINQAKTIAHSKCHPKLKAIKKWEYFKQSERIGTQERNREGQEKLFSFCLCLSRFLSLSLDPTSCLLSTLLIYYSIDLSCMSFYPTFCPLRNIYAQKTLVNTPFLYAISPFPYFNTPHQHLFHSCPVYYSFSINK